MFKWFFPKCESNGRLENAVIFYNEFEWDRFIASFGQNKNAAKSHLQGHIPKIQWHNICWVC